MGKIEKIKVDVTEVIQVPADEQDVKKELEAMDKEALLQRLRFEESDPKIIKLIKEILKTK